MAVSPQSLEKKHIKEVDEFEKLFDVRLNTGTVYKGGMITISAPSDFNSSHFVEIQKRYKEAGWSSLEFHNDKSGPYISFKY